MFLMYEVVRHSAYHELSSYGDREVMKWAMRRLNARSAPSQLLEKPFSIAVEVVVGHVLLTLLAVAAIWTTAVGVWR